MKVNAAWPQNPKLPHDRVLHYNDTFGSPNSNVSTIATAALSAIPNGFRASPLVRFLVYLALSAVVAGLSIRFFFPGYFDPFAIYHVDHYIYIGMGSRGYGFWVYFARYPRPIAHVLIDLCGRLGPRWLLMPVFVFSFVNAGLLAIYLERITKRTIAIACFLLFAALAYGNPEYYFNLKADPFATFALTFLLCSFHCWQSYVETGGKWLIFACIVLVTLFAFTKESYFCVLGLFFLIQVLITPQRRRAAIALLLTSGFVMLAALYRASQVWTLFGRKPEPSDPYYTSLAPLSVAHGLAMLGASVLFPAIAVALVVLLILAWRISKPLYWIAAAGPAFGVASLLPNSTLPNHLEQQYAWLGAYFLLSPFLFLDRIIPQPGLALRIRYWQVGMVLAALLLYGATLREYRSRAKSAEARWLLLQEGNARRVVSGLDRLRQIAEPHQSSLVTGLSVPYNPFLVSDFVRGYMGPARFWTVIVPDATPEATEGATRLIHASNPERLQTYDHLFVFHEDGSLRTEIRDPSPSVIAPDLPPDQLKAEVEAANRLPAPGKVSFYSSPARLSPKVSFVTIYWMSPVDRVEVRLNAPDGTLFAAGGAAGSAATGNWVKPGMVFYLQDASSGNATSAEKTLAKLQIPANGNDAR